MKIVWIIGIIVITLLILLGWWWIGGSEGLRTSTPSSSTTSTSCLPASQLPTTLTIEYQNNQFFAEGAAEPAEVFCVKEGATVTFKGDNLWVASTPHPTHNDLPGFDAKGEKTSYSFRFDLAGEWGFHNHLRATSTGTIIVVE